MGQDAEGGQTMATRTASELSGLAVLTINGGERLGRVEDVVIDMASGQATGFILDSVGMFKPARFLASADVGSLGTDALTVKSADVIFDAPQEWPANQSPSKKISGLPVVSEGGTAVGKVSDVMVNDSLQIPALVVATGILDNALHGKPLLPLTEIRTVGKDSVVVSNSYDPKATPNQTA